MPKAAPDQVRALAVLAFATAVLDLVVLAAFHLVQPGVDVLRDPTSAYVHGTLGAASSLAAAAVGIGALALVMAGWQVLPTTGRARSGLLLLGLFGLAKLAQAFFPIDAPGESTATGTAHNVLGNLAFFSLPVAAVLLTSLFATATGHGSPSWWPPVAAWTVVAATALVLAGDAVGAFGLMQRLYLIVAALWTALLAVWLWRGAAGATLRAG